MISKAAAKAEMLRREREREPFRACFERVHGYVPDHLDDAVDALEEATERSDAGEGSRLLFLMPPGYAKSTLLVTWCAWRFQRSASFRALLRSYSTKLARHHIRAMREIAVEHCGVKIDPTARSASEWRPLGGSGYAMPSGLKGGTATGLRADAVVVDDYHAGRTEAESAAAREAVIDGHKSETRTRLDRGGICAIACTPWHPADLAAWAEAQGYDVVRVQALDENDESTWPDVRSTAELHEIRDEIGPRDWQSLFCARPIATETQVFRDWHPIERAQVPPLAEMQIGIGLDLAYSERNSARDWSVILALGLHRATRRMFVIEVFRAQLAVDRFAPELASFASRYTGAKIVWRTGGLEPAIAKLLEREAKVRIRVDTARADLVVDASPIAVEWNAGRVLVVRSGRHVEPFVAEVTAFGPGARRKDQIAALVSAHAAIGRRGRFFSPRGTGEGSLSDHWFGRGGGVGV